MHKINNAFTRIPLDKLRAYIQESSSIGQIFRKLNLNITGTQYQTFKRTIKALGIDISHFRSSGRSFSRIEKPNQILFAKDSYASTSALKKRILRDKLKPYECVKCHNKGKWKKQELVLQLDHEDGDRNNNLLENLRFLCPNCHTQTPTHSQGGKRLARLLSQIKPQYKCSCGAMISKPFHQCVKCASRANGQKVIKKTAWPLPEEVEALVWTASMTNLASKLDVSPNGLKRFCKRHSIKLPPMGYWQRRNRGYSHEQALVSQKRIQPPKKTISQEQIESAIKMIIEGSSLRKAAKAIKCCHSTLLDRLSGHPVLLLLKHGNAKHAQSKVADPSYDSEVRLKAPG